MERSRAVRLTALLVTTACSQGPKLDLGSNDGGGSAPPAEAGAPSIAGTWSGYAELYTFPDGSDVITMTIAQAADGSYSGTIVFGTQPAPPPPTADQTIGYPPFLYAQEDAGAIVDAQPGSSGFVYTVQGISFDGSRLLFAYDPHELWRAWCLLQQPIFWPGGAVQGELTPTVPPSVGYYCAPAVEGTLDLSRPTDVTLEDGGLVPIDPVRYTLCGLTLPDVASAWGMDSLPLGICACTATSCAEAPATSPYPFHADLRLNGDLLDGSMIAGDRLNVHFTRH